MTFEMTASSMRTGEAQLSGAKAIAIYPLAAVAVAVLLRLLYRLPVADSLLWFFGVFFCFYVPGRLMLRWSNANGGDHILTTVHALLLGMAVAPLLYAGARMMNFPPLILMYFLGTLFMWGLPKARLLAGRLPVPAEKKPRVAIRTAMDIAVLGSLMLCLLHYSHFTDLLVTPVGFLLRATDFNETTFHVGIVNALRSDFPPMFPYASGASFSHYHVAMHLQIEMFYRIFGIDIMRLSYFYFPLFYFFVLAGAVYMVVKSFFHNALLAFVTAILMFGSDFSFIPGFAGMLSDKPWTATFQTTIWSLFTLNGNLPALSVFVITLFHMKRYFESGAYKDLALVALLVVALLGFKSSFGLHVAAAGLVCGIVLGFTRELRSKGAVFATVSALLLVYMGIDIFIIRGGAGNNIVTYDPFNVFRGSLKTLKIEPSTWYAAIGIFVVYCVSSFGIRIAGFWKIREVFTSRRDPLVIFLLIFVLSGFFLSELLSIRIFIANMNNAVWFSVASLSASWILLSFTLSALKNRKILFRFCLFLAVLLALPTTVQFLTKRYDHNYLHYGKDELEVVRALDRAPAGTVVLHPLNEYEPSLSANYAGHQTVLSFYRSLNMMPLKENEFLGRVSDVVRFFSPTSTIDRSEVVRRYGVDYVYAPAAAAALLDKQSFLIPLLRNGTYVLYAVDRRR